MTASEYFDRLYPCYANMYDMEQPYELCGTACLAHGYFCSHSEKFVLSREAKLWESNNFEHIFFIETASLAESDLAQMDRMIREYVEPEMVRGKEKYPPKNHMYTYITFVFLCSSSPEKEIVKSIKKYKYSRNYLFTIRGYCQARVVAADMESRKVYTNSAGSVLKKLYRSVMKDR